MPALSSPHTLPRRLFSWYFASTLQDKKQTGLAGGSWGNEGYERRKQVAKSLPSKTEQDKIKAVESFYTWMAVSRLSTLLSLFFTQSKSAYNNNKTQLSSQETFKNQSAGCSGFSARINSCIIEEQGLSDTSVRLCLHPFLRAASTTMQW